MIAALLGEVGAALERLDDEVMRDVAWEPEVDGGVTLRLLRFERNPEGQKV